MNMTRSLVACAIPIVLQYLSLMFFLASAVVSYLVQDAALILGLIACAWAFAFASGCSLLLVDKAVSTYPDAKRLCGKFYRLVKWSFYLGVLPLAVLWVLAYFYNGKSLILQDIGLANGFTLGLFLVYYLSAMGLILGYPMEAETDARKSQKL